MRIKSPFFATLALFARFISTQQLPTAGTDGKDIFFNWEYLLSLSTAQQDGLLLHEVLHAALLHPLRRGVREKKLWNIAADIVVNGMIMQQGVFELPPGELQDSKLEHFSVEEVYELLLKQDQAQLRLPYSDLLDKSPQEVSSSQNQAFSKSSDHETHQNTQQTNTEDTHSLARSQNAGHASQSPDRGRDTKLATSDRLSEDQKAVLEAHWKNALQQAMVIARTVHQGRLPQGMERELGTLTAPQLDWRSYLWRYLVQTPTDFQGFDRRFVYQGLYLESLVGESVNVFVAVDTSGSVGQEELQAFLSEVHGILSAYPHLYCQLYYADAKVYGPYELNSQQVLPKPQGGGGTSFVPFFEMSAQQWDRQTQAVCVYLTDGYGTFPAESPELPVLWVVTPGGLNLEQFPFGEAVRLLSL